MPALLLIGATSLAAAVILTQLDPDAVALPMWTAAILILSGAMWFCLPRSLTACPGNRAFLGILAVGLGVRLIYLASDPVLEIDYFRYLWDGAAVSFGLNPYAVAPAQAISGQAGVAWGDLSLASHGVVEQISYPKLSTIYPPVAQSVFVLAHWLDPWGLTGLRALFLLCELVGVGLLACALGAMGRARSWVAIYWWNPLIAKELANSAHMDAILIPLLAGILLMLLRQRRIMASVLIALAAGVKIWPLLFAPLALVCATWRERAFGALLIVAIFGLMIAPMVLGRLDMQSGLVAYSAEWERNDLLFNLLHQMTAWALDLGGLYQTDPGRLTRLAVALLVSVTAVLVAMRPRESGQDIASAMIVITGLLLLCSPTGYPWYFAWLLPFLCFVPHRGLLLLGVLMPLYYLRFAFAEQGDVAVFETWIVWIEFGPVFLLLAFDALLRLRGRR